MIFLQCILNYEFFFLIIWSVKDGLKFWIPDCDYTAEIPRLLNTERPSFYRSGLCDLHILPFSSTLHSPTIQKESFKNVIFVDTGSIIFAKEKSFCNARVAQVFRKKAAISLNIDIIVRNSRLTLIIDNLRLSSIYSPYITTSFAKFLPPSHRFLEK